MLTLGLMPAICGSDGHLTMPCMYSSTALSEHHRVVRQQGSEQTADRSYLQQYDTTWQCKQPPVSIARYEQSLLRPSI